MGVGRHAQRLIGLLHQGLGISHGGLGVLVRHDVGRQGAQVSVVQLCQAVGYRGHGAGGDAVAFRIAGTEVGQQIVAGPGQG
ncbi:hypothetical protein D3C81_1982800 [compost metagenome]